MAKYKELWEQEKQKNERLQQEIKQLKNRGAGRKPVLDKTEKDLIKYQYQCGMSLSLLAKDFGVSKSTIYNVVQAK